MLKNEIETLREQKKKLKQDMSAKEILIKSLTDKLNKESAKQMYQSETRHLYHLERETDLFHFKTLKMKC